MDIRFPYDVTAAGRTADAPYERHVREMIEQVLFTNPGERVNRPEFGCGLLRLVFDPTSDELAAALAFMIKGALTRWLGDVIEPLEVEVTSEDSTVRVSLTYALSSTGERRQDVFEGGT